MSYEQPEPGRRPKFRVSWQYRPEQTVRHAQDREPRYEGATDARRLALSPTLGPAEYYLLAPGREIEIALGRHHHGAQAIVIGHGELFMRDALHRTHCRTPGGRLGGHLPLATKLVSVFVHHRPKGPVNETDRLVFALDANDNILGKLDTSASWEMSTQCLKQMCTAAGLDYDVEHYDYFPQMWQIHPNWVDAEVEFEMDHPKEEVAREAGMFVWWASALALLLGGGYVIAFIGSPFGRWYRAFAFAGLALALALTLWAKSKNRMRRSMQRRGAGGR